MKQKSCVTLPACIEITLSTYITTKRQVSILSSDNLMHFDDFMIAIFRTAISAYYNYAVY